MNAANQRIAEDLGKKISDQVDELLRRELALAYAVLPMTDVIVIYLQLVAQLGAAAVGTVIAARRDDMDPGVLFDLASAQLAASVMRRKEATLATVERLERAA